MPSPDFAAFSAGLAAGQGQVLWRERVADLDTPVGAFLKLAQGKPNAFLLESIEGGAARGRYSAIGLEPDLIWRCRDGQAELNRHALAAPHAFAPDAAPPLDALRALIAECQLPMPAGLPPLAAGLFGYLGYDMVRLIERLPAKNADVIGLPEAILMRPTLIAVFDHVRDALSLFTPVWAAPGLDPQAAWDAAQARLDEAEAALERPLPRPAAPVALPNPGEPSSNFTRESFIAAVERAKDYVRAGDCFQVVPSQRFSAPFALPPFALYRALRRINPAPFLIYFEFAGFAAVGASPEILVRLRDGEVTIRPLAGTRRRGATPEEDKALEAELLADPKERAEHLMLLDLGRNDVGRVSAIVNLASIAGLVGSALDPLYSMTKGGVTLFTKSTAIEFGRKGYRIRVNSIHPGVIQTEMGEQTFVARARRTGSNDLAPARDLVTSTIPWGRLGVPDDIAKGILFLASDDAAYMNGAGLVVDGGFTAT